MMRRYIGLESVTPSDGFLYRQYGFVAARFAQYYCDSHQHKEAEDMLRIAIQYDMTSQGSCWPSDRRSLKLIEALGGVYWESNNLEEAEDAFRELLENSTMLLGETDDFTVHAAAKLRAVRDKLLSGRAATERAANASARRKQDVPLLSDPPQPPPGYSETETQDREYETEEYRLREIADQMKTEFGQWDRDTLQAIVDFPA
jgi:tetratricopeptide (TPR) repeat protein